MKHLYKFCTSCLLLACVLWNRQGIAQSHIPKTVTVNSNCGGYYEYLPQGYSATGTQRYPLIIYIHGDGDRGSGSQTDLAMLPGDAIPKYINDGLFPVSFTSNGQQYKFIVISPQFVNKPVASEVTSVLNYVKNNYKVDTTRVYVTGMSMGGGTTWEYAGSSQAVADKIAAIVPVCGASTPNSTYSQTMAATNLPVWATHNQVDYTVTVENTNGYVNYINGAPVPPHPLARKTIFPVTSHDAWTQTYNPTYRENGLNVYEWMLQFQRTDAILPVTLTNYKITSASKQAITIGWTTTAEQHNQYFSIERSTDGVSFSAIGQVAATNLATGSDYSFTDSRPATGNNFYRLIQTDINGKTTHFSILKTIIDAGVAGSLVMFPNPATTAVTVGFNHPDKDRLMVKVINPQGMVIQVNQYNKEAGYWQQQINIGHLAAGQYFIQVKGTVFESTQSLLINK